MLEEAARGPLPPSTHARVRAHTHSHLFLFLDFGRAAVFVTAPSWNGFDEMKGLQPLAAEPFRPMESCSPASCVEQTKVV